VYECSVLSGALKILKTTREITKITVRIQIINTSVFFKKKKKMIKTIFYSENTDFPRTSETMDILRPMVFNCIFVQYPID
jgi:hypothetical protein